MKTFSKNPKLILLLAITWLLLIFLVQFYYIPTFENLTGLKLLDLGGYKSSTINAVVSNYGIEGIKFYHQIQVIDFFAPLMLGLLLSSLCFRLLFISKGKYFHIGYFPLLLTLFDFTENGIIFYILNIYPNSVSNDLAKTLLTVTTIKNIFYATSFLMTFGLTIHWLAKKLKQK